MKCKQPKTKKQVFNISQNIFNYKDAESHVNHLEQIALLEQLIDSYKNGANWCNYGWSPKNNGSSLSYTKRILETSTKK